MEVPFENSAEVNGQFLGKISKDFAVVSGTLKEAAYQLKARNISSYPVFVVSKDAQVDFGSLLIAREELHLDWNYRFSYLEDLLQRTVISEDRVEAFKAAYKNIDEFACLLVVDREFLNFIFVPYPAEESTYSTLA